MPENQPSRRIRILREEVSRKIAAGEVIDRPLAVVRELLDNALDAGASSVEVLLEGGGLSRIRVTDDGEGMAREDLELCAERHATSKIEHEDDLLRVATLGFRGEALASIAACARLTLTSRKAGSPEAWRLAVEGGARRALEPCPAPPGTTVDAVELFFNLPARKKFLKSPASEAQACRQVFLDKALPHPRTVFRLRADGVLKLFLPAQGLQERAAAAYALEPAHLMLAEGEAPGARVRIAAGRPEISRRDRRLLQVFVNRRRISDFSLLQAVEYAYGEHVPGGSFPVAFVFLEVDPALVDFNIHPAKKEARFRNLAELRQLLIGTLRKQLGAFDLRAGFQPGKPPPVLPAAPLFAREPARGVPPPEEAQVRRPAGAAPLSGAPREVAPREAEPAPDLVCLGQVFGLFLAVEQGQRFYLIDQHAAHERLLFDELSARPLAAQELLLPISLEGVPEDTIRRSREAWRSLGIGVERREAGGWEVTSLPQELLCLEEELAETLASGSLSPEELRHRVLALAACRSAVKDGEELDPRAALELARRALALDNARCPHGRPLWLEVSRRELFKAVGRE